MPKWFLLCFLFCVSIQLLGQDTIPEIKTDSMRYTRFKQNMYKRKFTKQIYQLLFRDVYNRNHSQTEEVKIEENPFVAYDGYRIRNIRIKQLNALGGSVYDTTRTGSKLERFISKDVHVNTRERTIRTSMLLFEEKDWVEPNLIKDNERILRQSNIILDARILPVPIEGDSRNVDILVIIQDVWPVTPEGSFSGFDNFSLGIKNENLLGSTHSSTTLVRWRGADTLQKLGMRSLYTVPFYKRTYIARDYGFIWERDLKQVFAKASKPFISVETKYAGAIELGIKEIREYRKDLTDLDRTFMFPVRTMYSDAWIGRAFKIGESVAKQNKRVVVAARHHNLVYVVRPEVTADSNRAYWNQSSILFSLGFSNRNYKRDLLIFGFGRTEDVPIGSLLSFTGGQSFTEYGRRGYLGSRISVGQYLPGKYGYLYGLLDLGSYLQKDKTHQGVLSTSLNYFTPLMHVGINQIRQFVNFGYTHGYNRDALELIQLDSQNGLRGISPDRLIGKKRLHLGLETVLFGSRSIIGFRNAYFGFADFGMISDTESIWKSKLYQGYGLGIRLRNESLAFNTIELRIAYYTNIPALSYPFRFGVSGATSLRFRDFDISAPDIVPFR